MAQRSSRRTQASIQPRILSALEALESVYPSLKQRTKAFFNNITSNTLDKSERFRRSMLSWNLLIRLFILHYNRLRRRA